MIARLVISPDMNKIKEELALHLKGVNVNLNHPDLLYFPTGEKLGIAQAKKIKEHFSLKPYSAKGRIVIIEEADVLTDEAQNALLKTFEELPKEAMIILGAKSDANLLPTILSRCQVEISNIKYQISNIKYNKDIDKLLSISIEERFKYIEKLKDREEFLNALVAYFHQKILEYPEFSKELLQAEQWQKQNVNIRAILEYLMLSMPSKLC